MEITCINCPMGCALNVDMENGKVNHVAGAACKRGFAYAERECTNPTRIVTSTVPVHGGKNLRVIPVKTDSAIPKNKIADCLRSLQGIELDVPVRIGDVVVKNVCGTGVDIVAARNVCRAYASGSAESSVNVLLSPPSCESQPMKAGSATQCNDRII